MPPEVNNRKELESFFTNEYRSLRSFVKSRLDDAADRDAEDIIQDVALKLFSRTDYISPINNVAGYVYHSLKNSIIDILRSPTKRKMSQALDEVEDVAEYENGNNSMYLEVSAETLRNAILELKPPYRDLIVAYDFEGFSYKQLSEKTGIAMGTLMSRRHRALAELQEIIGTKNN